MGADVTVMSLQLYMHCSGRKMGKIHGIREKCPLDAKKDVLHFYRILKYDYTNVNTRFTEYSHMQFTGGIIVVKFKPITF